jgi:hypothetical protein
MVSRGLAVADTRFLPTPLVWYVRLGSRPHPPALEVGLP